MLEWSGHLDVGEVRSLKVKKLKCLRNRSEITRGLMFVLFVNIHPLVLI